MAPVSAAPTDLLHRTQLAPWGVLAAVRWNGYEGSGVGNPQARGRATWFILPTEFNRPALPLVPLQNASQGEGVPEHR
jgi:hypothetical protein